jgi:hypothetical protein
LRARHVRHLSAATLGPLAALLAEIEQAPPLPRLLDQILDAACRLPHADAASSGCTTPPTT